MVSAKTAVTSVWRSILHIVQGGQLAVDDNIKVAQQTIDECDLRSRLGFPPQARASWGRRAVAVRDMVMVGDARDVSDVLRISEGIRGCHRGVMGKAVDQNNGVETSSLSCRLGAENSERSVLVSGDAANSQIDANANVASARPRSFVGPAREYDSGGANQMQAFVLSHHLDYHIIKDIARVMAKRDCRMSLA